MKWWDSLRRHVEFRLFHVKCGKQLQVCGRLLVGWKVNLTLGDGVIINSGLNTPNPIGNEMLTSFTTAYNGKIVIGNRVGISNTCFYSREGITVEDDVMIGGGCMIFDTDFHPLSFEERVRDEQDKTKSAPVRICRGAFIGARSIIMKGVTVGEHSVVGAGSVVTKSIPPNEVWGGNPAKMLYSLNNR